MLISMTGFGQSEVSVRDTRVSVEIRTVNHRFLDFSMKMPKDLNSHEKDIKDIIKKQISRGRISVTIAIDRENGEPGLSLDLPLMERYLQELTRFAKRHKLQGQVDINTLALLPDVFSKQEETDVQAPWAMVQKGVEQALGACMKMRRAEGKALERDVRKRLKQITKLVGKMEKAAPQELAASRKALRERVGLLLEGAVIDQDRLMTELSIMADRLDFTEEITRLKSHIDQFNSCLDETGAVSKKLTYILQEIHREVTTAGSKASSTKIIEYVVLLKEESEKLREQVQNIE